MHELRVAQGSLLILKNVLECIDDIFVEGNFDWSSSGVAVQAMDSSQVALVALLLRSEGFEHYRCDRNISMGMNLNHLKGAGDDDTVTMKAADEGDTVTFRFESPTYDKIANYTIKRIVDIDSKHLGIPEAEKYHAIVRMPSAKFAMICKDLSSIGDTIEISVTWDEVEFSTEGDIGATNIVLRENTVVDRPEDSTTIKMNQSVSLTVDLRYLTSFTKATPLSGTVTISLSSDRPVAVEYKIADMGHIRFYSGPIVEVDIEEDDEGTT